MPQSAVRIGFNGVEKILFDPAARQNRAEIVDDLFLDLIGVDNDFNRRLTLEFVMAGTINLHLAGPGSNQGRQIRSGMSVGHGNAKEKDP